MKKKLKKYIKINKKMKTNNSMSKKKTLIMNINNHFI